MRSGDIEAQWALRLIESDDIGGKHSNKDGLITHAPVSLEDPGDIIPKGANFIRSVSGGKARSMIRILWKEEVGGKFRGDNADKKGKVVERLGAIIGLFDPKIGIIDIFDASEIRDFEVLRK